MRPVLYSFRRCPYAMRARMAIQYSNTPVELREVILRDKPPEMLKASDDTTVPLLILPNGEVINESLDIMYWALKQHDPDNWLLSETSLAEECQQLIARNDHEFKPHLDSYKYFERFPQHSQQHYRAQGEQFLIELENRLKEQRYLVSNQPCIADIAIFPFIRQFAYVDKQWFYAAAAYLHLIRWLDRVLESKEFGVIMVKYDQWHTGEEGVEFPVSI